MSKPNLRKRPKSLSERTFRNFMSIKKTVTIRGKEFTMQSVSFDWYMEVITEYQNSKDIKDFYDSIIRSSILDKEIQSQGLGFFGDDVGLGMEVGKQVARFLRDPYAYNGAGSQGDSQAPSAAK